jgi:uncharacterized protein (TIGR02147 family)
MDVHDFLDWRDLVRAVIQERGMVQRELALRLGVSEGNLSMLLTGRRAPSPELVARFAEVLFSTAETRAWFEALVDLQASNPRAQRAAEAVVRSTLAHLSSPSPRLEIMQLQSDWRANAIEELATCDGFRPDPEWIAERIVPPIEPSEVTTLWERLLSAGLVIPQPDGKFEVRSVLHPPDLRRRAAVEAATLHESALSLAAASIHRRHTERRGGVVTMALSEPVVARMLIRVREMEQELVAMAAHDPGPRNRVFIATLQLFPCSEFTDSVDVDEEPRAASGHGPGDDRPR